MAQVRKTPDPASTPAVVRDISEGRARAARRPKGPDASAEVRDEPSPAHAARLEALKQQIARGEYNPDPDEIARKILERGF